MADPTPLNRNQIAAFVGKDPQAIRAIERLFTVAGELTPAEVARLTQLILDNSYATGAADNKAEISLSIATSAERLVDLVAKGPMIEAHNSLRTDYLDFNANSPQPSDNPGRIHWNPDDGTLDIDLYGGSTLQVGQETQFYAKNTSGALIANGSPVMFTGAVGASGKLTFGLAIADGSVPSNYMMGVATQDIADNDFGYITDFGLIRGIDATGTPYGEVWADGNLLYFDPATPGAWTNVKPVAPSIAVPVAVVVNAGGGGSGSIFVRMELSETLNCLQDVYINGAGTPLAGNVLIYDATQARWENHFLTAGANITITNGDGSVTIAVSGLGTIATQNANDVAITGGTINGTVIGGTTPAAVSGTTGTFSGNLAVDTNTLFVNAAGNKVGVGNASPVVPLHVTGATMTTGVVYSNQPAQTTKASAATLTIAELLTGIIQYTGAAANLTLPTGTLIEGGVPATFPTNMSFNFSVINTGSGTATLVTAAGLTLVGSMAVAAAATSLFRVRKTALNTYTVYRIG